MIFAHQVVAAHCQHEPAIENLLNKHETMIKVTEMMASISIAKCQKNLVKIWYFAKTVGYQSQYLLTTVTTDWHPSDTHLMIEICKLKKTNHMILYILQFILPLSCTSLLLYHGNDFFTCEMYFFLTGKGKQLRSCRRDQSGKFDCYIFIYIFIFILQPSQVSNMGTWVIIL